MRCPPSDAVLTGSVDCSGRLTIIEVSVLCLLFGARNSRHTTAVQLLEAGVDRAVIALWLGHEQVETTQIYLDADLAMKERALARTAPLGAGPGRFRPRDSLLAFLEAL